MTQNLCVKLRHFSIKNIRTLWQLCGNDFGTFPENFWNFPESICSCRSDIQVDFRFARMSNGKVSCELCHESMERRVDVVRKHYWRKHKGVAFVVLLKIASAPYLV